MKKIKKLLTKYLAPKTILVFFSVFAEFMLLSQNKTVYAQIPTIDWDTLSNQIPGNFKWRNSQSIGDVISSFLSYLFIFAGIGLLVYLVLGGFKLMTSAGDPKAIQSGKSMITNAVVGFIIIFISYWLVQAVGLVFGISAFSNIFGPL